jgi:hypothetical protein
MKNFMPIKSLQKYPKVSFVFPTMNRRKDVVRLLKSIYSLEYPKDKIEIIMADNCSSDDTVSVVRKEFPKVKIIENKYNFGTSIAFNQLVEKSIGDYIFMLDDDEIFEKNCLRIMMESSLKNPNIVFATGLFYYNDKKRIRNLGGKLNPFFGLKSTIRGKNEINIGKYKGVEVEIIAGGTLLIKKEIFDDIGGFDERYFLSHDDIDWEIRLKKKGYKIVVIPEAIIYHNHKLNEKPSPFYEYHLIRGKTILLKKHSFWFLPLWVIYILIASRSILKIKGMFAGLFSPKKIYYTKDFKRLIKE